MIIVVIVMYILGVALIAMGSIADDGDTLLVGLWTHIIATVLITIKMMGGIF